MQLILGEPVPADRPPVLPRCRSAVGRPLLAQPLGAMWAVRAAILPTKPSGERLARTEGSAWPPGTRGPGSEPGAGPAWAPGCPCPSSCAECRLCRVGQATALPPPPSALQGSWADACLVRGSRACSSPALCPPPGPLGALAALLCSRQPQARPASPAQRYSLTSGVVCLGKDLLVLAATPEGCDGRRFRLLSSAPSSL